MRTAHFRTRQRDSRLWAGPGCKSCSVPRFRAVLLLIATVIVWGTTFHLARFALGDAGRPGFTPFSLAAVRFPLAALMLLALSAERSDLALLRRPGFLFSTGLLGAIGILAYNLLFYQGIVRVNPAKAALIAAANPGITALLIRAWKRESLGGFAFAGIVTAFLGVVLVILGPLAGDRLDLAPGAGDLFLLGASTAWAVYSVYSRDLGRRYGMRPVTTYALLLGSPGLILPALVEGHALPLEWGPWLAVAYMALFATALAYRWWGRGVEELGPAPTAIFINLIPITAFGIEYALGGGLHPTQIAGGGLVVLGVWLTGRGRR